MMSQAVMENVVAISAWEIMATQATKGKVDGERRMENRIPTMLFLLELTDNSSVCLIIIGSI